jgi:CheY-like chemotaxis protein
VRVHAFRRVLQSPMLIAFLTTDLVFPSRIRPIAERLGARLQTALSAENLVARLAEAGDEKAIAILDLSGGNIDPATILPRLKSLSNTPLTIIAFAPHVHESKLDAARNVGCDFVLTRGQFDAQIESLLERLASDSGEQQ